MKIIYIAFLLSLSYGFGQDTKFNEKVLNIPSEKVTVNGTLLAPDAAVKVPLVILIPGSGMVDRNGGKGNYLKYLAIGLSENNIATYRYDKSALALLKSKDLKEEEIVFDDFIVDAIAVVDYFKDKEQFSKIIFAGHSQGSLVAMMASALRADAYISIAGAGREIDAVLTEQMLKQSSIFKKDLKKTFDIMRSGKIDDDFNPLLTSIFRKSLQSFWISWMKYNPQEEIKKLTIPILIVNGTKDIQVPITDAALLHKANAKSELLIIEDMNHVFKEVKTDDISANIATYTNAELPIKVALVNGITAFVGKLE